ncbi:MAG: glucose-1-phosphate thymidylyltransferase RfbA [Shewanella sp.]|nr:glucose-1-phosphate thymidylyltransferase RfbA [Shewanella sp.]
MKGIVLAGGSGTRLYPLTKAISKQLLPVYDKPMIFYPLSVLMLAQIRDILIITTKHDQAAFQRLLGDGSEFGINLSYQVQLKPNGIAEALILAEAFIGEDNVSLILGDNIFYGQGFVHQLTAAIARSSGASIFSYQVTQPERFGVVEFNDDEKAIRIVEKPTSFISKWAVTGLYLYDNNAVQIAKDLTPSARGELEITEVNQAYLDQGQLHVEKLGRGMAWLDTGTFESLHRASAFVETLEQVQGLKIACLEEIAWRNTWLSDDDIKQIAKTHINNDYGKYLSDLVNLN